MLKRILKWTGIVVGSLLLLIVILLVVVYISTNSSINKSYTVNVQPLTIPTDTASYEWGQHVVTTRGCVGCHGENLSGGRAFADESSPVGVIYASNLTNGKGGIRYGDTDWVRALRHGVDKNNHTLWFMPSHEICHISNRDLAALISYVKAQPTVDREIPQKELKPLGRVLAYFDKLPLFVAEKIDHNATYVDVVNPEVSPAYGKYLSVTCQGCHGADLKGSEPHGPNEPPIPNITASGDLGRWKEADLVKVFATGYTPTKKLAPAMPWKDFRYTDNDVKAIYAYLRTLK